MKVRNSYLLPNSSFKNIKIRQRIFNFVIENNNMNLLDILHYTISKRNYYFAERCI